MIILDSRLCCYKSHYLNRHVIKAIACIDIKHIKDEMVVLTELPEILFDLVMCAPSAWREVIDQNQHLIKESEEVTSITFTLHK